MLRLVLLVLAMGLVSPPALADGPAVTIELNKLEANGSSCRAYLMMRNDAGAGFESLKLDLVMFDTDGVVSRRIAVEAAPLPAGKTSLKVFDIADQPCDGISRMLLNDILDCHGAAGPRHDCLDLVETASRTTAPFIK
ncbi:MAG: Tat pathway signal sequence domain protein [Alphaproteobacteria bacterium]